MEYIGSGIVCGRCKQKIYKEPFEYSASNVQSKLAELGVDINIETIPVDKTNDLLIDKYRIIDFFQTSANIQDVKESHRIFKIIKHIDVTHLKSDSGEMSPIIGFVYIFDYVNKDIEIIKEYVLNQLDVDFYNKLIIKTIIFDDEVEITHEMRNSIFSGYFQLSDNEIDLFILTTTDKSYSFNLEQLTPLFNLLLALVSKHTAVVEQLTQLITSTTDSDNTIIIYDQKDVYYDNLLNGIVDNEQDKHMITFTLKGIKKNTIDADVILNIHTEDTQFLIEEFPKIHGVDFILSNNEATTTVSSESYTDPQPKIHEVNYHLISDEINCFIDSEYVIDQNKNTHMVNYSLTNGIVVANINSDELPAVGDSVHGLTYTVNNDEITAVLLSEDVVDSLKNIHDVKYSLIGDVSVILNSEFEFSEIGDHDVNFYLSFEEDGIKNIHVSSESTIDQDKNIHGVVCELVADLKRLVNYSDDVDTTDPYPNIHNTTFKLFNDDVMIILNTETELIVDGAPHVHDVVYSLGNNDLTVNIGSEYLLDQAPDIHDVNFSLNNQLDNISISLNSEDVQTQDPMPMIHEVVFTLENTDLVISISQDSIFIEDPAPTLHDVTYTLINSDNEKLAVNTDGDVQEPIVDDFDLNTLSDCVRYYDASQESTLTFDGGLVSRLTNLGTEQVLEKTINIYPSLERQPNIFTNKHGIFLGTYTESTNGWDLVINPCAKLTSFIVFKQLPIPVGAISIFFSLDGTRSNQINGFGVIRHSETYGRIVVMRLGVLEKTDIYIKWNSTFISSVYWEAEHSAYLTIYEDKPEEIINGIYIEDTFTHYTNLKDTVSYASNAHNGSNLFMTLRNSYFGILLAYDRHLTEREHHRLVHYLKNEWFTNKPITKPNNLLSTTNSIVGRRELTFTKLNTTLPIFNTPIHQNFEITEKPVGSVVGSFTLLFASYVNNSYLYVYSVEKEVGLIDYEAGTKTIYDNFTQLPSNLNTIFAIRKSDSVLLLFGFQSIDFYHNENNLIVWEYVISSKTVNVILTYPLKTAISSSNFKERYIYDPDGYVLMKPNTNSRTFKYSIETNTIETLPISNDFNFLFYDNKNKVMYSLIRDIDWLNDKIIAYDFKNDKLLKNVTSSLMRRTSVSISSAAVLFKSDLTAQVNDKLYLFPNYCNHIGVINLVTKEFNLLTSFSFRFDVIGTTAIVSNVVVAKDKIFIFPMSYRKLLVLDTLTDSIHTLATTSVGNGFSTGCLINEDTFVAIGFKVNYSLSINMNTLETTSIPYFIDARLSSLVKHPITGEFLSLAEGSNKLISIKDPSAQIPYTEQTIVDGVLRTSTQIEPHNCVIGTKYILCIDTSVPGNIYIFSYNSPSSLYFYNTQTGSYDDVIVHKELTQTSARLRVNMVDVFLVNLPANKTNWINSSDGELGFRNEANFGSSSIIVTSSNIPTP